MVGMQQNQIPNTVSAKTWAKSQKQYYGYIEVKELKRLCELLVAFDGKVYSEGQFGFDTSGKLIFSGTIKAEVDLQCQRCMGRLKHQLQQTFRLCVVADDNAAKQLSSSNTPYEPLICEDDKVSIKDVLEDEIILGLPVVAMHATQCAAKTDSYESDEAKAETAPNPFASLKALKTSA